jgi:ketosteroid isomerase-like protein
MRPGGRLEMTMPDPLRAPVAFLALALSSAFAPPTAAFALTRPAAPPPSPANPGRAAPAQAEAAVTRTVEEFTRAQRAFDPAKLASLTTADYLEISPLGEVDPREKMLGFYAPENKGAAPELAMSEVSVRQFGDSAVLVARMAYKVQPPGQPVRTVELRAGFVLHRAAGAWKIASSQYTGIRPAAK